MINNEINSDVVRLVQDGKVTDIKLEDALRCAEEQELDLICVNNSLDIPVVKIGDYNKYIYEQNKKKKEAVKKARINSIDNKEIQIRNDTANHDLMTKANKIDKLLLKNSRIKIVIKYRGREKSMMHNGPYKLNTLLDMLKSKFKIEESPKIDTNNVYVIISSVK